MKEQKDQIIKIPSLDSSLNLSHPPILPYQCQEQVQQIYSLLSEARTTWANMKECSNVLEWPNSQGQMVNLGKLKEKKETLKTLVNTLDLMKESLRSFGESSTRWEGRQNREEEKMEKGQEVEEGEVIEGVEVKKEEERFKYEKMGKQKKFDQPQNKFGHCPHQSHKQQIQGQIKQNQIQQFLMKVKLQPLYQHNQLSLQTSFPHHVSNSQSSFLNHQPSELQPFSLCDSAIYHDADQSKFTQQKMSQIDEYRIDQNQKSEQIFDAEVSLHNIKDILSSLPQKEKYEEMRIEEEKFQIFKKSVKNQICINGQPFFPSDIADSNQKINQTSQSFKSEASERQEETTEERSSRKSHPFIYEVPLNMKQYVPQLSISPIFSFSIENKNFPHQEDNGIENLDEVKNMLNGEEGEVEKSFQSNMNLNIGIPIDIMSDNLSEGNRTDRDMFYPQKLNQSLCDRLKFKEKQCPVIDASEFYELKEKLLQRENEKLDLVSQLQKADIEIKKLFQDIKKRDENIILLERESGQKENQFINVIKYHEQCMRDLQEELTAREQKIDELDEINFELTQEREHLNERRKTREEEVKCLKEGNENIRQTFYLQMDKLNAENNEKGKRIRQLEKEVDETKNEFKMEVYELTKLNDELRESIEELNKDLDSKKSEVQKLQSEQNEIVMSIEKICQEEDESEMQKLAGLKKIYSSEVQRLKEEFDSKILQEKNSMDDVKVQNQQLKEEIKHYIEKDRTQSKILDESIQMARNYHRQIQAYKEELKKQKIQISADIEEEISYLRKEVVTLNRQLELKNIQMKELHVQLRKVRISQPMSVSIDLAGEEEQNLYIADLKAIIGDYEGIIQSHHRVIKQLQENVYEFVQEAVKKEEELEEVKEERRLICMELQELKKKIWKVEAENGRFRKMISSSEKKISAIGFKLANFVEKSGNSSTIEFAKIGSQCSQLADITLKKDHLL